MGQYMPYFIVFMIILVIASLVVASCWTALTRSRVKTEDKPIQSEGPAVDIENKESAVETVSPNLFWIEHVPTKMCKLKNEVVASATVQAELLEAGFELLRKLPTPTRDHLNLPVSADVTELFLQGGNLESLPPERVRAAVAVAEASLALSKIMFELGCKPGQPHPHLVSLDESTDIIVAGDQPYNHRFMLKQISRGVGVSEDVATEMWHAIIQILREDLVSIPGLKGVKSPETKRLQRSGQ